MLRLCSHVLCCLQLEDSLEREKRNRQEIEKTKRKVESEVKVAQETIDELNKQKHDIENNLRRFVEDVVCGEVVGY